MRKTFKSFTTLYQKEIIKTLISLTNCKYHHKLYTVYFPNPISSFNSELEDTVNLNHLDQIQIRALFIKVQIQIHHWAFFVSSHRSSLPYDVLLYIQQQPLFEIFTRTIDFSMIISMTSWRHIGNIFYFFYLTFISPLLKRLFIFG